MRTDTENPDTSIENSLPNEPINNSANKKQSPKKESFIESAIKNITATKRPIVLTIGTKWPSKESNSKKNINSSVVLNLLPKKFIITLLKTNI